MKIKIGLLLLFVWSGWFSMSAQVEPLQKKQVMTGEEFEYAAQKLKSVEYNAVDALDLIFVTDDSGTLTDFPQWSETNAADMEPVVYISGATPTIKAIISNCTSPIWIKGIGTLNGTGGATALTLPPMMLTPVGGSVTYGPEKLKDGTTDFVLTAEKVAYYEKFDIEWKFCSTNSSTESDWVTIETSSNPVYATYKKPDAFFPFHTVIHLGCKNADGISGPETTAAQAIVDAMWVPFASSTFDVHRVSDDALLTYYADSNPTPAGTCVNLAGMLGNSTGDGRCGAMGELFYRMIKDQGLTDGIGNAILPAGSVSGSTTDMSTASIAAAHAAAMSNWTTNNTIVIEDESYYFLVKEWSGFSANGFIPLVGTTFNEAQSSPGDAGIPGQGNVTDPRSIFPNHVYIHFKGKIYDPSYGVILPSTSLAGYEDASLNVVSGTIVKRMVAGVPEYYFWVETINDSSAQLQEFSTTF